MTHVGTAKRVRQMYEGLGWHWSRLMIIGAHGQLGAALGYADPGALKVSRTGDAAANGLRADLLDRDSIRAAFDHRPSRVILTAAYTNVAGCETDADSWAINVGGTAAVVEEAERVGASVTFISTDYVFGGKGGPYDEDASPYPLNAYGRQKLNAETIVREVPGNLVVRTCQLFGPDFLRRNYVLRVADSLRRGEQVKASSEMKGTPTYAPDLAKHLVAMKGVTGTRHIVGPELVSRYDLARRVAEASGLDPALIVDERVPDGVERPLVSWMSTKYDPLPMTPLDEALRAIA